MTEKLIMAVPKGRILKELEPILRKANIIPEDDFFDKDSRKLRFITNDKTWDIIRVRSSDVTTFVAFGAAAIGVAGSDILAEFDHDNIYAPIDLGIGKCRMSLATTKDGANNDDFLRSGHVRVATKYPRITHKFFETKGVQAECIKLNGAMELAPTLGLCRKIVDLVSTGNTLKANGLVEVEKIADVSSYLIVNRVSLKTQAKKVNKVIEGIKEIM